MSIKATSIPTKTLASSITSSATSFTLSNILGWNGSALTAADFGDQAYCVFRNAARTQIELMEFNPATIASSSITITRRGLKFDGTLTTEVSANKLSWTKGDTFVDLGTDTPQLFQWYKDYIDAALVAGAPNATETVKGIVEIATAAQYSARTATGETGASLVTPNNVGPVIETTAGTTHSLTTIASQRVMVWASGQLFFDGTASPRTVSLRYNAVTKHSVDLFIANTGSDRVSFALMYTETPGAATQNIDVITSGGTLVGVVIMVLKF